MTAEVLPLVSCVIPVYNGARWLAETLDSVLAQTYRNCEILVVDDGSTDDSAEVASRFAGSGVELVRKANGGTASARNLGVVHSRGELIAFLDADDLWLPGKLARQVVEFAGAPTLAMCATYMQNFWIEELAHEAEANPALAEPQPGPGSTVMIARRAYEAVGALDERLANRDIQEWVMRARLAGWEVRVLAETWVRRRIHGDNLSRRRVAGEDELLAMARTLLDRKRKN
jgi:glycosyltransferase involved in cell wall biosynthesis